MGTGNWTRAYLVRHGEVDGAWAGRFYGDLDVPLSETGREQAREAARRLARRPLRWIVSSDLERAHFGARELLRTRPWVEHAADPRWREISRGQWAGKRFEDVEREFPGAIDGWNRSPFERAPAGGESLADLERRVLPAFAEWMGRGAGGEVAVVAHGWVLRTLLGAVLGLRGGDVLRIHVPPASIAVVDGPIDGDFGEGDFSEGDFRGAQLVALDADELDGLPLPGTCSAVDLGGDRDLGGNLP